MRSARKRNVLGFHIEIERIVAAVAADPGGFHAAEWGRQVPNILGIEPDHASFKGVRDAQCAAHVRGPDVTCEAILYGVRDLDGIVLIAERNYGQEWSDTSSWATRILE